MLQYNTSKSLTRKTVTPSRERLFFFSSIIKKCILFLRNQIFWRCIVKKIIFGYLFFIVCFFSLEPIQMSAMINMDDQNSETIVEATNSEADGSIITDCIMADIDITVYSEPDITSAVLGILQKQQVAIVFHHLENNWYEIYYAGQSGYIPAQNLVAYNGANEVTKTFIYDGYKQPLIINALGDSIVYGDGLVNQNANFLNLLGRKLNNASVNNYGLCGSALSGNHIDRLLDRYLLMEKNADIIFVMGGTNDFGYGVLLGTMQDKTDQTFYGGLNLLMCGLTQAYPDSTIIFLTPIKRTGWKNANSCGYYLSDYVDAVEKMGAFYGIQVVNLYEPVEVDFSNRIKRFMPDGLHPNIRGHVTIANYLYETLKN